MGIFVKNSEARSQNPEECVKCILTAGGSVNVYRLPTDGISNLFVMHERHAAFALAMTMKSVD